jgi:flavin-dependent dehydrogenase
MNEPNYDVIIVGAGPAGLSAAFFCGKANMKVLVLEKNNKPGLYPRGETIHDDPILDEILGEGVMKSLELHSTSGRLYHSPVHLKEAVRKAKTPSIVFDWDEFISKIYDRCKAMENIEFQFGVEILGPIYSDANACEGVFSSKNRYYAHSVISSMGHTSLIANSLGLDFDKTMNLPVVKCLISNYQEGNPGFEYYFMAENQFPEFPNYPSGVAFVFPRNPGHCEIGFMLFTQMTKTSLKNDEISDEDLMKFWSHLKTSLPGFADRIKGAKVDMEMPSRMANVRILDEIMMRPGLFLIGDSAGMVEASGGSGLVTGMKAAKLASQLISKQGNKPWDKKDQKRVNKEYRDSVLYKKLKKNYKLVGMFQGFLFGKLKTVEKINKRWKLVQYAYKLI